MNPERALISHFTRYESMETVVESGLRATHFVDPEIGRMFEYALRYFVDSGYTQPVSRSLLEDEFRRYFSENGWPDDDEDVVCSELIRRVIDNHLRVSLQDVLLDVGSTVMANPREALTKAVSSLTSLQLTTSDTQRTIVYGLGFQDRLDEYFDRATDPSRQYRGVFFGWPQVTDWMWGLRRKELAIVAGAPGLGKSWTLSQIAVAAALDGSRVYYASLENDRDLTARRIDCLVSGVPYRDYERGTLRPEQIDALRGARDTIVSLRDRLVIDNPKSPLERTVAELYARARFHGAELVVGDQLSWVMPRRSVREKWLEVAETITEISDLTKEYEVASVWAVQVNREGRKQTEHSLEHLSQSDVIGQIADWVFGLRRSQDQAADEVMVLEVLKSRRADSRMAWLLDWRLRHETLLAVRGEYSV